MTQWARLPKVELHLHLEGAAPPEFIRTLAAEQGADLGGIFDAGGGYAWRDFADFLRVYETACSVLRTPRDHARLMRAVLDRSADTGVVYTEIFVAPDLWGEGSPAAGQEYLAALGQAMAEAEAARGIISRLIVTAIRHFDPGRAETAARLAAEGPRDIVVGFGLAGDERQRAPAEFARAFAMAGAAGLGFTAHAGEVCGAQSVRAALDALPVSRIGHGVRAIEDADLVRRLVGRGITLEVNPGSNLALGLYPELCAHPIARLRDLGVAVTVSTDDPPYFRTDLSREYEALAKAFGWGVEDFRALNLTAAEAAFCDAATRARVITALTRETA